MIIDNRRRRLVGATVALAAAVPFAARAQDFPGTVHLVHGYNAGSAPDILARSIAPGFGARIGANVVVDARPGAGERLAAGYVARQPADGRTFYVVTGGQTVVAAYDRSLTYDLRRDFSFVSTLTKYPFMLLVAAQSPYRSLADLIEAARQRPGRLTYSSSGVGTTLHLAAELINTTAGVKMNHAPYKGTDAYNDLIGGVLDMSVGSIAGATGLLREGRLRAIAVTSGERWPGWPDVPSVAETVPGYDVVTWMALAAPAGLSAARIEQANRAIVETLAMPEVVARVENSGALPRASRPEALQARVLSDIAKWEQVVAQAGLDLK